MMAAVLRELHHTDLLAGHASLAAYLARCEARPAFQRALAAQLAPFEKHRPTAAARAIPQARDTDDLRGKVRPRGARTSVGPGNSVSVRVDLGVLRLIHKKNN